MRKIMVPPAVEFHLGMDDNAPGPKQSMLFDRFITQCVNSFPMFGKGFENSEKRTRILEAVRSGKPEFLLDEQDYLALRDAVQDMGWNPIVAGACRSFYVAINTAEQAKP